MPSIITNQAAENMLRELLRRDGYRLKRRKQTWEIPESTDLKNLQPPINADKNFCVIRVYRRSSAAEYSSPAASSPHPRKARRRVSMPRAGRPPRLSLIH